MTVVFLKSFILPMLSEMPISKLIVLTFQVPSLRVGLFEGLEDVVAGALIKTSFSAFGLAPHTQSKQTRMAREFTLLNGGCPTWGGQ